MENKPGNQVELDKVEHIGIVVRDIEKVTESWSSLFGIGPWTIREMGGGPVKMKMAFASLGALQIELIQPVEGRIFHSEFLDTHGEGVHHIAFQIKGMDEQIAILDQKGMPLVQTGDYTGGRYAYVDGGNQLKIVLELLENF